MGAEPFAEIRSIVAEKATSAEPVQCRCRHMYTFHSPSQETETVASWHYHLAPLSLL